MSAPVKTNPAPFDARQLADTIDTMGLLVASLSDRVDAQGRMLEQVLQVATEARAAAFAAEKATDWKRNGDLINEGLFGEPGRSTSWPKLSIPSSISGTGFSSL
jgi:hypothetical protein